MCPFAYTCTRNIHTHEGRQTVHNSTKVKPKPVLTNSTCKGSPRLPNTCPTKAPQLSSFQTCPQAGQKDTYAKCMQDFLSTQPANLAMWLHYRPEKNARFGNKSKYTFLGIHHSQTHRTAWLLWSPVQKMGVRGGKSFLMS